MHNALRSFELNSELLVGRRGFWRPCVAADTKGNVICREEVA